ncbi:aldo/keto reductase [Candidatus Lucifugimonas marina]|uniref:Aldo/keto reductase n=1 Tax=Candidatus Lucifugimonas marina TaxID=3038979 RepID=A0AAJ5ZE06_9CHLR|nr:aldo/keto reductase [SAR202 cluster bacterium JH702]MDG0869691.1 aldo/keto reductase [SAR202 cluster bacterium JH639]WFG34422.1 aldo/keto reductase [SAR202 cluster bacterium JH545]WFG38351.1 aldo/keto reductase [SAR202 cluster bacterium JH1073]
MNYENSTTEQSEINTGTLVPLGQSGLNVSPVGTGTWQWGGAFYWGYGRSYTDSDLAGAYSASIENGINWFDTAEIYGRGRSEKIIAKLGGKSNSSTSPKPLIATKFFPYPWRWHRSSFRRALNASLKRINTDSIDLYQIHFPFRPRSFEYWVDALGDAAQEGLIKAVGVSNFSTEQTKRAHELLAQKGIVLASNQVGYSLLNRAIESNGVKEACHDLGISVISYGPLAEGLLTGKYQTDNPPPLLRKWRWARKRLKLLPPLISLMSDISTAHDVSVTQVALNWLIQKETLPIPGAKSAMQAADNAAAMTWKLADNEFKALNNATQQYVAGSRTRFI